ncbi:hypothetical protein LCGC14_0145940 [marine sediment metagenome]|uniref:Uncharacterized protein n=1 Tax=marine sediment metagenome TaxID=412755 RepID=A0A0F9Y1D2_9ZZZZ
MDKSIGYYKTEFTVEDAAQILPIIQYITKVYNWYRRSKARYYNWLLRRQADYRECTGDGTCVHCHILSASESEFGPGVYFLMRRKGQLL